MSLLSIAKHITILKGLDYFEKKNVISSNSINEFEYEGIVLGSNQEHYQVKINLKHPKKSLCNCPHASNSVVVCKHKVALYFESYPDEASNYFKSIDDEEERDFQELQEQFFRETVSYVMSLSKRELQIALIDALLNGTGDEYYIE